MEMASIFPDMSENQIIRKWSHRHLIYITDIFPSYKTLEFKSITETTHPEYGDRWGDPHYLISKIKFVTTQTTFPDFSRRASVPILYFYPLQTQPKSLLCEPHFYNTSYCQNYKVFLFQFNIHPFKHKQLSIIHIYTKIKSTLIM
jgi:hypothetical protein